VRARAGAPVALPLEWRELNHLEAANQFTIRDVLRRLEPGRLPEHPRAQRLPPAQHAG
jgi:bifunctional non-homologous end joining protein LigD